MFALFCRFLSGPGGGLGFSSALAVGVTPSSFSSVFFGFLSNDAQWWIAVGEFARAAWLWAQASLCSAQACYKKAPSSQQLGMASLQAQRLCTKSSWRGSAQTLILVLRAHKTIGHGVSAGPAFAQQIFLARERAVTHVRISSQYSINEYSALGRRVIWTRGKVLIRLTWWCSNWSCLSIACFINWHYK